MNKNKEWEVEQVISELLLGQRWTNQLQTQLKSRDDYSQEQLTILTQRIYDSFGQALSMLNHTDHQLTGPRANGVVVSPGSPLSAVDGRREVCKKRKSALPKWTKRIKVSLSSGMEAPQEDGYSWRKYGQKDILGAKYPRSYFRCTHKHAQSCPATKQVQRLDKDPSIFEVNYRGHHSCFQASNALISAASSSPDQQPDRNQILINFGAGLKVKTEGVEVPNQISSSSTFPFPPVVADDSFLEGLNFSTATCESNYFPLSPASTTMTNTSPLPDMDFSLDSVLGTDFSFDHSELFLSSGFLPS